MKWFLLILPGLLLSLLLLNAYAPTQKAAGSAQLTLSANEAIGFQDGNQYLTMNVTSGSVNNTASIVMYESSGEIDFTSSASATIRVTHSFPNAQYKINGESGLETIAQAGTSFSFGSGDRVSILWHYSMETLFPILFALGMFGLAALFGSGVYGAYLINNRDFNEDKLIMVLVTFALGFGLFIAWVMA